MLIGILSDSHGRHGLVRQAMALFDRVGVEHVIHCGDIGGLKVFEELVGRPLTFVWGNTDHADDGLITFLTTVGIRIPTEIPTRLELDGKRFAVFHGFEPGFQTAAETLEVDYILHGHTHVVRDELVHDRRVINPGALHHARRLTVATLDTKTDEVTVHHIPNG